MHKKIQILSLLVMTAWICTVGYQAKFALCTKAIDSALDIVTEHIVQTCIVCNRIPVSSEIVAMGIAEEEIEIVEDSLSVSDADIELIALVTMAEAEGESEEGKRLVIDTVLNRVDSNEFPDTIRDVIYQKSQFTSMWNGRVDQVEATEEVCQLVREELKTRKNTDVIFFTARRYGKYGTPLFKVGNHYFSGH